jgi:hypothetical protein
MYTPIGVYPLAQTAPISINIQVSGKDMAASAGSGKDEEIGQPPSMTTNTVAEEEDTGLLGGLLSGSGENKAAKKSPKTPKNKGGRPQATGGRRRQKYIESTSIEEDSVYFDDTTVPSLAFVAVALSILLL